MCFIFRFSLFSCRLYDSIVAYLERVDGGLSVYSVQIHYKTINKITFVCVCICLCGWVRVWIIYRNMMILIALCQPPNDSCPLIQMICTFNRNECWRCHHHQNRHFDCHTVYCDAMCCICHTCGWGGHSIGLQHIEFKHPADNSWLNETPNHVIVFTWINNRFENDSGKCK